MLSGARSSLLGLCEFDVATACVRMRENENLSPITAPNWKRVRNGESQIRRVSEKPFRKISGTNDADDAFDLIFSAGRLQDKTEAETGTKSIKFSRNNTRSRGNHLCNRKAALAKGGFSFAGTSSITAAFIFVARGDV